MAQDQGPARSWRVWIDRMVRQRIPDRAAGEAAGPVWINAANGTRRTWIGIESQMYQRGCAPSCPVFQTGRGPPVSAEPCGSGARCSGAIIAGPRNYRNRHGAGQPAPVAPAVELGQIVAAHQPDKFLVGIAPAQRLQGIDREHSAKIAFDRSRHDRRAPGQAERRLQAGRKRSHPGFGLKRIARRNQPPHRIKVECLPREQADPPMPAMGRIEAATQQTDALWVPAQGRTCPVPRTSHL